MGAIDWGFRTILASGERIELSVDHPMRLAKRLSGDIIAQLRSLAQRLSVSPEN
jgi:hypothetical protein